MHTVKRFTIMVMALSGALVFYGCPKGAEGGKGSEGKGGPPPQSVKKKIPVEFYVMSQCPYGTQVIDGVASVLQEKLGNDVDFKLEYIGREKDGKLTSMHGESEVKGDIISLCALKYYEKDYRYFDLLVCMDKDRRKIPTNWEDCARQHGMDVDKLKACYEGQEGQNLLSASFKAAQRRRATGSPTIYINNRSYRGKREPDDFTRGICQGFPEGDRPPICADVPPPPPPVKVAIKILGDKRCKECRPPQLWQSRFKSMFEGAEISIYDYSTEEGKKLFEDYELKLLPAILFDEAVKKTDNYKRMARFLSPKKDMLVFRSGAKFDPTKEICDNGIDDTGNGKVDCTDPDCEKDLVCRDEIPKKLDLFVMSQCPYGTKALDAMKEVLESFGKQIDFDIHYIARETEPGKFQSLHRQPEVDDNIRELCAMKYYPKDHKYMDYILCRNKGIMEEMQNRRKKPPVQPDPESWKKCVEESKMDLKKMTACADGDEGKKLLSDNIKMGNELGIGASPTWIANNRYKFSGIAAEQVREKLCEYNKNLDNCDKKLSGMQRGMPGGACK
ncbi:MAG: DsbA family protein [Deltaproteobacteria bacterium]|nr:DsbA family protein [Deltaproteobacteria bacterium]